MDHQALLSVVSGTYNRKKHLMGMIQSVRDTLPAGISLEFVIVDGGSTDGTLDWLRQQSDVVLIEHSELRGAIPAFCDGAKAATGKYVVLANDDILFKPGALLAGIVHLEEYSRCGGVAFADNRKNAYNPQGRHLVQMMPAWYHKKYQGVRYAQVGMFRKWLGDEVGWWGADDPDFTAKTYGGDNYLSARIWELGYTIDEVPGCRVDDLVIRDALRELNNGPPREKTSHSDTEAYYTRFPEGTPELPDQMKIAQQDIRHLRILYLPIYEPGHAIQKEQKRGLRNALQKVGWVYELDYLASRNLDGELLTILERWQPDLLLTQLHGADRITTTLARKIRQRYPKLLWINWNGDYWPDSLIAEPMLKLLQYVNLQLVVNASVLNTYQGHGIPAAYWQIGFEEPTGTLPDVKAHDVVFLGNAYHPSRKELEKALRATDWNVGFYGQGWEKPDGECLYDFATGKALYNNAKLAIGDNMYPDAYGFVSNRLFQAMAAGGALLLHQEVPGLRDLTGLVDGQHYKSWLTIEELMFRIEYYLDRPEEAQTIADTGTAFVHEKHSFDARVYELFDKLIPLADKPLQDRIGLKYLGKQQRQFSVRGRHGIRYSCIPDQILFVDSADVDFIMRDGVWEKVSDIAPNDRIAQGVPQYGT
jgi:glycosyltransferase involved in cell wall biosynthesis